MEGPHRDRVAELLQHCWAKTGQDGSFHPVLRHMLDVGEVARGLLDPSSAPPRFRVGLGRALGADPSSLWAWLPWLVALHDVGKISASFQAQVPEQKDRVAATGLPFPATFGPRLHHAVLGAGYVSQAGELRERSGDRMAAILREVVGGHHGSFQAAGEVQLATVRMARDTAPWPQLRDAAMSWLADHLVSSGTSTCVQPPNATAAAMVLTGFTILCDWLGSDAAQFPVEAEGTLAEYADLSRRRAAAALRAAGFRPGPPPDGRRTFAQLFPAILHARPLQVAVDALPQERLQGPCLCLIEAPTGEGKTEAALAIARRLAGENADEVFFALPTEATSNQMYARLSEYFAGRPVKLIHGHAFLVEDDLDLRPAADGPESADSRTLPLTWFSSKKRALLAPLGVGTVDQVELAALNAKHVALRLTGLMGKVLIIDEVHAYDTYMSTIIEQLLRWLQELGTSVVLLSATLPRRRRDALLAAYGAAAGDLGDSYPLLAVAAPGTETYAVSPPPSQALRKVELAWMHHPADDVAGLAAALVAEVSEGGCAAWICNTVARAQALYQAVSTLAPDCHHLLLHSRFPQDERQLLEAELISHYGPPGRAERPARGLVIGTQVLEQSLDLDFDVMFTDLAPTDLVLQRAGRMHRHPGRTRPARHAHPRLVIHVPVTAAGEAPGPPDTKVYDGFVLVKSLAALRSVGEAMTLPADTRRLIEATYDGVIPEGDARLAELLAEHRRAEAKFADEAKVRLIVPPTAERPLMRVDSFTFDEDEGGRAWLAARTRLGDDALTVIPLYATERGLALDAAGRQLLDPPPAPRPLQLRLLRRGIRLTHGRLVPALRALDSPPPWGDAALLSSCRPLVFGARSCRFEGPGWCYRLSLDPELGLVIESERNFHDH